MKNSLFGAIGFTLGLLGIAEQANADQIFMGTRAGLKEGNDYQIEERIGFSENDKGVGKLTNVVMLKYWDGDEVGKWGIIKVPYTLVMNSDGSYHGLGDISIGAGPRGRIGNVHGLPYIELTLPTGDAKIGNRRYDLSLGVLTTFLTDDKRYEIDGRVVYSATGDTPEGKNVPDTVSGGVLAGIKLNEMFRIAAGLTGNANTKGEGLLSQRNGMRLTLSPDAHFEVYGDVGVLNHVTPLGYGVTVLVRYNF